ncbi:MAG: hypothetical protein ACLUUL_03095, partial [Gemmiger sp.]
FFARRRFSQAASALYLIGSVLSSTFLRFFTRRLPAAAALAGQLVYNTTPPAVCQLLFSVFSKKGDKI